MTRVSSWRINQKPNSTSLWTPQHVRFIPLSSQKIENDTCAWANQRWCQGSGAGFCWGGETRIRNFFTLMASSCSAGLRFYGCPHVRMWRGAAAWQRRSRLRVSSRPDPLEGRSGLPATGLQNRVRHWSKPTANEKNICLKLSFVFILWDASARPWSSLHSPRRRPDGGMNFIRYDDCLLSLLLELLPSQSQTLAELFSFRTSVQDFNLAVGFKIQSWEKHYKKNKINKRPDNCITVHAVSLVQRRLNPPARALKAELAECRLQVTTADSCSCDSADGEWTLKSTSYTFARSSYPSLWISNKQHAGELRYNYPLWSTSLVSTMWIKINTLSGAMASMFSLGSWRAEEGVGGGCGHGQPRWSGNKSVPHRTVTNTLPWKP